MEQKEILEKLMEGLYKSFLKTYISDSKELCKWLKYTSGVLAMSGGYDKEIKEINKTIEAHDSIESFVEYIDKNIEDKKIKEFCNFINGAIKQHDDGEG
jgi:hypothetical protein